MELMCYFDGFSFNFMLETIEDLEMLGLGCYLFHHAKTNIFMLKMTFFLLVLPCG